MNLVIYTNAHNEEDQQVLYDLIAQAIILQGDYYHDKINCLIDGYVMALNDWNLYAGEPERISINKNHELFKKFDFDDRGEE